MNTIERLNNIIKYIDASREKKRESTSINFDDINLDDLNLEIVIGSKVNIQSENDNFNLANNLLLENYLKSISKYKKYRNKTPKYSLNTLDLSLDINLEIKQKVLIEKIKKLKTTPDDIKRDINITLLENLKTSIFLYKNIHKVQKYKANFDDLHLDIELETTSVTRKGEVVTHSQEINTYKEEMYNATNGEKTNTSTLLSNRKINKDRVDILKEKLDNIRKFKERAKVYDKTNNDLASNLNIDVTLTKKGKQLISLNKKNKIKKLEQLLASINSYRERRNEL